MLKKDYHKNVKRLMEEAREKGVLKEWMRFMCRNDIFFLLVYVLGRTDLDHYVRRDGSIHERDWLYDRCNEVQATLTGTWTYGPVTTTSPQSSLGPRLSRIS